MVPFLPLGALCAYGTKVPSVLQRNLYFLSGQKLAIWEAKRENKGRDASKSFGGKL